MMRIVKNKNLRYNLMFIGNRLGIVSNKKWSNYCDGILQNLLIDNKDVLQRMKFK